MGERESNLYPVPSCLKYTYNSHLPYQFQKAEEKPIDFCIRPGFDVQIGGNVKLLSACSKWKQLYPPQWNVSVLSPHLFFSFLLGGTRSTFRIIEGGAYDPPGSKRRILDERSTLDLGTSFWGFVRFNSSFLKIRKLKWLFPASS